MIVDSNKKVLTTPEIITASANQTGFPEDIPLEAVLLSIAKEGSLETADTIQIGNTVFLGQTGTGKNKNKMVGRAFNIDTGKNFVENGFKYFDYLREKGITHYSTRFTEDTFLNAFRVFQRRTDKDGSGSTAIGKLKSGGYVVYLKLFPKSEES